VSAGLRRQQYGIDLYFRRCILEVRASVEFTGSILPCDLQLIDVIGIDLIEVRILLSAGIPGIDRPLTIGGEDRSASVKIDSINIVG